MNALLKAALNERDSIVADMEMLTEVVDDIRVDEETRMCADIKLHGNAYQLTYIDRLIELQLEKLPIETVLKAINTNLSTKCN